jgi:hypothetical protein
VIYSFAASFKSRHAVGGHRRWPVWVTRDHGKNWKNITPPKMTPWSKVTQISASHFDDNTAYVSVSRMRIDDMHPYLFRTRDGGATWESITAGLPDGFAGRYGARRPGAQGPAVRGHGDGGVGVVR